MKTKQLAATSVLCALSVVILFLGNLIGIGTYAGPLLAIWVCLPVLEKYGAKAALMTWLCVSILAVILVPDKELTLFYAGFGWYPAALKKINRISSRALRLLVKSAIYLAVIAAIYSAIIFIAGIEIKTGALEYILLAAGLVIFFLADRTIPVMSRFLAARLKNLM